MSRTYPKLTNKHHKYPEVYSQEYLYNTNEFQKSALDVLSEEIETALSEDIRSMRKSFRRLARRMRNRYS